MSNEDKIILAYMTLLNELSIDLKLKLIAKLTESVSFEMKKNTTEPASWKSLFGVWKDMDDDVAETIRAARFSEREVPNLDI